MKQTAVIYCRVSSEKQTGDDKVSIDQQLERSKIMAGFLGVDDIHVYKDDKKYIKTQPPNKGKWTEPSGKWEDRPEFQKTLAHLATGEIDYFIAFDITRMGRSYAALGAIEKAWEAGNQQRNGRGPVKIYSAKDSSQITGDMFGMLMTFARMELKNIKSRLRMGREGTLAAGRWPGAFNKLGYTSRKVPGQRGCEIILDKEEAERVKLIFDKAEELALMKLRLWLVANKVEQKNDPARASQKRIDWNIALLRRLLRDDTYTGKATWRFKDGKSYVVDIPQIITPEQFNRVQRMIEDRKTKSPRNTKAVAACQFIAWCGECDCKMALHSQKFFTYALADGSRVKKYHHVPRHRYRCGNARNGGTDKHAGWEHYGPTIDRKVWRHLVDNAIKNPDLIREQVEQRRKVLQAQGSDVTGDIAQKRRDLEELDRGRQRILDMAHKGLITQEEAEAVIQRNNLDRAILQEELSRLEQLRDEAGLVLDELNLTYQIMRKYETKVTEYDISQQELQQLDEAGQRHILEGRKEIIQALCERIDIYPDGRIEIHGLVETGGGVNAFCLTDYNSLVSQKTFYGVEFLLVTG